MRTRQEASGPSSLASSCMCFSSAAPLTELALARVAAPPFQLFPASAREAFASFPLTELGGVLHKISRVSTLVLLYKVHHQKFW